MITAIMVGAGNRGIGAYGDYAERNPEDIKFVGVAETDPVRRSYFARKHSITFDRQYEGYESIFKEDRFADACFICTQDNMHFVPASQAMKKGYHLFLEKPMAITPKECVRIGELADFYRVRLMIGHVLRYTQFFSAIKRVIDSGKIGKLMTIQHNENVSYWHQAHSYVRGNWRNVHESSPMILAKSCHDLDILAWFADSTPASVSSFGSLSYFTKNNVPEAAPEYCMDGCPHQESCVYFAPKVYLNAPDWMKLPVSNDMSDAELLASLKKGPYGRCVYQCDNDVVDHQVVIIEFENAMTASFTMTAFTHENTRTLKVMGTAGEIRGHMDKNVLEIYQFGTDTPEVMSFSAMDYDHGGGDYGIMKAFCTLIEKGEDADAASNKAAIQSHLLAFAAEQSRVTHQTIEFKEWLDLI